MTKYAAHPPTEASLEELSQTAKQIQASMERVAAAMEALVALAKEER